MNKAVEEPVMVLPVGKSRCHVWCKSKPIQAAGSFPDMQELSVFPAEIIKMLALVGLQKASKRCNDVP